MAAGHFNLSAGHVALDLVNTLDDRYAREKPVDLLATYEDLLDFCIQAQVVTPAHRRALQAIQQPGKKKALAAARELRELFFRIFTAIAQQKAPAQQDIDRLNSFLARYVVHGRMVYEGSVFRWSWLDREKHSDSLLWPILQSGVELLTSDRLQLVRECGAETCRWLFLDLSKNHTRRWCDMKTCGNRVKARVYYQRKTAEHL